MGNQKEDGWEGELIAWSLLASSPFTLKILAYMVLRDFKVPNLATYDGIGNLAKHLIGFHAKMMVVGTEDPLLCRAFFPTLTGVT